MVCPEKTPERMTGIFIIVVLTVLIYGWALYNCYL